MQYYPDIIYNHNYLHGCAAEILATQVTFKNDVT